MKNLLVFILALILVFSTTGVVIGGTTITSGSVGGITVWAEKAINQGGSTWGSYVWSHSAASIGTIGWTWWTIRQECTYSGTTPFNEQYNGQVSYNSDSKNSSANVVYRTCPDYRDQMSLKNMGNHDFKQGADIWRPYVERVEVR